MKLSELQKKDLEYIFHPCSQMKDYETLPPMVITRGKGVYLYDEFGKSYLDAVSSWWVNLFGHCNERINNRIIKQISSLEHVIFSNFSHKPAIELCEKLIEVSPKNLKKVLFAENGSSAIEIALKISFQYWREIGKTKKIKFVSLINSYHGETLGALGVTDVPLFTDIYKPLIKESIKVQGPDCFSCTYGLKRESCQAQCFEHMEKLIAENHNEIAAVIVEPLVQGAAGMKIYPPIYLKKLAKLLKEKEVHFIADEIAVGFGRTGKFFAIEHAEVEPDILCTGKGLTAGYFPMALTLITDEIYNAFYNDYLTGKSFLHSHSYSGNPIGCAIAAETLDIFKEENTLATVNEKGIYLKSKVMETFKNHPNIGEYRNIGFIGAIEILKDIEKREFYPSNLRVGFEIYKIALRKGVILRPIGNVIYFMPPYVTTNEDIDKMVRVCKESLDEFLEKVEELEKNLNNKDDRINFEV